MTAARYAIGLGCDRGTPQATLQELLDQALARLGAQTAQVVAAASIDLKSDEAGLLALAQTHGWAMQFYPAARLAEVPVPHPSETVRKLTGTPSVSEASALLAGGGLPMTALVVEKHKHRGADGRHATISIARIS